MKTILLGFVFLLSTSAMAEKARFGQCTKKELNNKCYNTVDAWCDPWRPNDQCIWQCVCPEPKDEPQAPESEQ